MIQQHSEHHPIAHKPDTLVEDFGTAEAMAHAAAPHYEKLIEGGDNLPLKRAVEIGIHIGEDMESARRDYVKEAAGSLATKEIEKPDAHTPARGFAVAVLAASEQHADNVRGSIPSTKELTPTTMSPVEVENEAREKNVRALVEIATSTFNQNNRQQGLILRRGVGAATEEMVLYDPKSRWVIFLEQKATYDEAHGRQVRSTQLQYLSPIDNIAEPIKAKKPNIIGQSQTAIKNPGLFSREQPMAQDGILVAASKDLDDGMVYADGKGQRMELSAADVSAQITRLAQSVPLSKEEFNEIFKKFDPGEGGTNLVTTNGADTKIVSYQKILGRKTDRIIKNAVKRNAINQG